MTPKGEKNMRIFAALVVLFFSMNYASADLFQYGNPFPSQTNSYSLNNIYEISPEAITKEKQTNEKIKKSKWWQTPDTNKEENTEVNEGLMYQRGVRAEDSGFIMFK